MSEISHGRRVLIVVNEDWFFLLHRAAAAERLMKDGYEVVVAAASTGCDDDIRRRGFQFEPLRLEKAAITPIKDLRLVFDLARVVRRHRPDAIHLMTLKAVVLGSIAARLAGRPAAILSMYGRGIVFSGIGLRYSLLRAIVAPLLRVVKFVALSGAYWTMEHRADADFFRTLIGIPPENIRVLPGAGFDEARFYPSPEPPEPTKVLFASRLLYSKGLDDLIAAIQEVRLRGIDISLIIAGIRDSSSPDSIPEAIIATWSELPGVSWLGPRKDVHRLISECHFVALPSRYGEGVPRILIETAACGRAAVSSEVPGCSEIVQHGVTGLLVPPGDIHALADSIALLAVTPVLRASLGRNAARRALHEFSRETEVKALADLYDAVFSTKGGLRNTSLAPRTGIERR